MYLKFYANHLFAVHVMRIVNKWNHATVMKLRNDNNALLASAVLFFLSDDADAAFSLVTELFLKGGHSRELM